MAMETVTIKVEVESSAENCSDHEHEREAGRKRNYGVEEEEENKTKGMTEVKREKKRLYDMKRRKARSVKQRAKDIERSRNRRANMSEEERAKERERSRKSRARAKMSFDDAQLEQKCQGDSTTEMQTTKNSEQSRNRRAKNYEEQKARDRERIRRHRANMSEEEKAKVNEKRRIQLLNETPEQREKRLTRQKQRKIERYAEMTEEEKSRERLRKYLVRHAREACESKEERQIRLKKMSEYVKNYMKNPENRERHRNACRRVMKRLHRENPEHVKKHLEYQRERVAKETPEQRQLRLRRYKINAKKARLKRQLESEGILSPEEIDIRCQDLVEKMKSEPLPPPTEEALSQYKPRPSGRKRKKMTIKPPGREPSCANVCTNPLEIDSKPYQNAETNVQDCGSGIYLLSLATTMTMHEAQTNPIHFSFHIPEISQQGTLTELQECELVELDFRSTESAEECLPESSFYPVEEDDIDQSSCCSLPASPSPPQSYTCPHCSDMFTETSNLTSHIVSTHEHPWKCPICSEIIHSSSHLRDHFRTHQTKQPILNSFKFVCMRCPWTEGDLSLNRVFKTNTSLLSHVQRHHPSSFWPCPACNLLLYSEARYKLHLSTCSSVVKSNPTCFICDVCGKQYKKWSECNSHRSHQHHLDSKDGGVVCPSCGKALANLKCFWLHFTVCMKMVPHIESPDSNAAKTIVKPERRPLPKLETAEERKAFRNCKFGPIPCEQCGKTFTQKCTLDDHVRRDHQGISHMCPQCGRNFQSAGKQWRHQVEAHGLTDLPPPPYIHVLKCMYCQDYVMRGYELHMKKKHPEHLEEFMANEYPKIREMMAQHRTNRAIRKYKLVKGLSDDGCTPPKRLRLRTSEEMKIQCQICWKVMNQGSLSRHMRRCHNSKLVEGQPRSATEPYYEKVKCSDCDECFSTVEYFRRHYSFSHACDGIEKILLMDNVIRLKSSATPHLRTSKEYVCLICDTTLQAEKYSVRVHFVTRHYNKFLEVYASQFIIKS